jgi:hypothetical protein
VRKQKTIKELLSNLTPEQNKKFGKELEKALKANRLAKKLEKELGFKIGNETLIELEKNKDIDGLHLLSDAMSELFLCRFVYESLFRVGEEMSKMEKTKGKQER